MNTMARAGVRTFALGRQLGENDAGRWQRRDTPLTCRASPLAITVKNSMPPNA